MVILVLTLIEGYFSMDGHLTLNLVMAYERGKFFKDANKWPLHLFVGQLSLDHDCILF